MLGQLAVIFIHLDHLHGWDHTRRLMPLQGRLTGYLVEKEEIGLALFLLIQQMHRLHAFLQIIHYIVIEIGLQHIFYGGPELFLYIDHIGKNRRSVIPIRVLMQEFYTLRIAFHGVDKAL